MKIVFTKESYNELLKSMDQTNKYGTGKKTQMIPVKGKNGIYYRQQQVGRKQEEPKNKKFVTPELEEKKKSPISHSETPTSTPIKFTNAETVAFNDHGNIVVGKVTGSGGSGATIEKNGIRYHVNYNDIQNQIPADKFDANEYKNNATEKNVTAEFIYDSLAKDPQYGEAVVREAIKQTHEKLDQLKKTLDTKGDSEQVYKVNGEWTPERQKLHDEIINKFFEKAENCKPKNGEKPKFVMLGGRGGSGKSWFTDKKRADKEGREVMFNPENYMIFDADAIKDFLKPPYEGWNAGEVHEESSYLNKLMIKKAKQMGLNIIIDGTMNYSEDKPNKARDQMIDFKNAGYSTEAHYMFLPVQESAKRAVMRFAHQNKDTKQYDFKGRLVPMSILLGMKDNEKSFDSVKDVVDNWSFRDNNVERGQQPKLVSQK